MRHFTAHKKSALVRRR